MVRIGAEITVKVSSNFDIKWFLIAVEHEQAAIAARARAVAARDASSEMAQAFDDELRTAMVAIAAHEAELQRNERAYNARRDTYVDLVRHCILMVHRVQLTEPLITFEGEPGPPAAPTDDEWRDLQARVDAFGSREVAEAAETFHQKTRAFGQAVGVYRLARDQPGGDLPKAAELMTTRREEVYETFKEIRTMVRDELANL